MNDLRKFVLIIAMCVIGALTLLGMWWTFFVPKGGAEKKYPVVAVEVEKVRVGSIVQRVDVVGKLEANEEVVIRPEVEGKIKKQNYVEGSLVKEGDILVEIDDGVYAANVKEAEAQLQFAKQELERYTIISAQQAGRAKDKQKAESDVLQAEARLDLAKIKLKNTVIRAPFDGLVGLREYSVGAYVDPRVEKLLTITDVDPIKVVFSVPARYLISINKGQEVNVIVDSIPNQQFKAIIDAIDPKVDETANSVSVRASIPNGNGMLKPGLFARVNMTIGSKAGALLVSDESVLTTGDKSYVYKIVDKALQGGQVAKFAAKTEVTRGMTEGTNAEISPGPINEGDLVVTKGISKGGLGNLPVKIVDDVQAEAALAGTLKEASEKPKKESAGEEDADADQDQKKE